MAKLPPGFVEDLKSRIRLSDVIGRRVKLKRQGHALVGLSPFNHEKTPSFYVHDREGFYKCFSSGEGGDAIKFIQDTERLSFIEAVERLADLAGVEMPKATPQEREQYDRNERLVQVCEAACRNFQDTLLDASGAEARRYLEGRGLDIAAWQTYRLGYAPNDSVHTVSALKAAGFTETEMIDAGLCIKSDYGNGIYNRFRGRLIFPITDTRGRVIAFGGRALLDDQKPKYLNSSDSPIFHKSHVLYNYRNARQAWAELKDDQAGLIVCEGYMDVIALSEYGFKHAVAPLGTALTDTQLDLVWRAGPQPIVCFDGDSAGQKAAKRVLTLGLPKLEPRKSLKFCLMPESMDPDDILKSEGKDAFANRLTTALPASEMLWQTELKAQPLSTPEQQADLDARLMAAASTIANAAVAAAYKRMFRGKLWDSYRGAKKTRAANEDGAEAIKAGDYALPKGFGLLMQAIDQSTLLEQNFERLSAFVWPDAISQQIQDTCLDMVLAGEHINRTIITDKLRKQNYHIPAKFIENYPLIKQKLDLRDLTRNFTDSEAWLLALEQFANHEYSATSKPHNEGMDIASLQKHLGLKRKETLELKNRMRDLTSKGQS